MIASLAAGSCSEIRNAVEDFLRLVWTPGDARPDLLPLIRALDRLAWLACGCKFDFDDACYPEPPARMNSRAFSQAEVWLQRFRSGVADDHYAIAVDNLAGIINDLEAVAWRFENTSAADALFDFELGFQSHWGRHLRSLQLFLHEQWG